MHPFRLTAPRTTVRLAVLIALAWVGLAMAASTEDVTFANGDVRIAGTLALPDGAGPHAAVVLVSGSGPQDRDSTIPGIDGYRPFAEIAERLAAAGIAVLRYDDRGAGASSGDHLSATTADLAGDARAAVGYLLHRSDIDPLRVGVMGHSEGAMIAPMLAARDPSIAFVVSLAPPVADALEGLVLQEQRILRASGATDAQVADGVALARTSLELNAAADWDGLEALLRDTVEQQLAAMPEEQRAQFGDPDQAVDGILATAMTQQRTWQHWFLGHDAAADWRDVRVPALVIFGGRDVQVDLDLHRAALDAALADMPARARGRITVMVLPEANHLFQRAASGGVQEYGALPPTLMPELLDAVEAWTVQTVAPSGSR